jgi:hypothetical protein
MLNCETKNADRLPDWLKEYPVTLTQFLFYLYHNVMVNLSYFLFAKLFCPVWRPDIQKDGIYQNDIQLNTSIQIKPLSSGPSLDIDNAGTKID